FFYYVMPYVEGETLRDRIARSGELPVTDALRLLGEITEALAVAHKAGVVHRDIKPENILLSGRHALVMDFGVAKAVTEASGRQQLTTAGVALGTPAYMAPEQATADPQLDHRVDIYALGVLAYEMLTGHPPFHGLTPQQTLAAHVTQAPVPVTQRRPGIAPVLDALILRCLAKRPADRFQTADELGAALEPLATPSGGMTPTHTMPISAVAAPRGRPR
ncbi:MAG: serine/threonine protein kinase, partial [Gemmatimonadetes bacterium]|nr:serine/threonine protein kinase [Gemmatimonadota bacterium]